MLKIIGWRKYFRFPSYLIRQLAIRWRLKPCKPISCMQQGEKSCGITSLLPFTNNNTSEGMQPITISNWDWKYPLFTLHWRVYTVSYPSLGLGQKSPRPRPRLLCHRHLQNNKTSEGMQLNSLHPPLWGSMFFWNHSHTDWSLLEIWLKFSGDGHRSQ